MYYIINITCSFIKSKIDRKGCIQYTKSYTILCMHISNFFSCKTNLFQLPNYSCSREGGTWKSNSPENLQTKKTKHIMSENHHPEESQSMLY